MAFYKQILMLLMLMFFFQTTTAYSTEGMNQDCYKKMTDYCGPSASDSSSRPKAIDCVKKAIAAWTTDTINDEFMREYYESFREHLNITNIRNTNDFCGVYLNTRIKTQCMDNLKEFGKTKEEAFDFAIYSTTLQKYNDINKTLKELQKEKIRNEEMAESSSTRRGDNDTYGQNPFEYSHFGLYYMRDIINFVQVNENGMLLDPVPYCDLYIYKLYDPPAH